MSILFIFLTLFFTFINKNSGVKIYHSVNEVGRLNNAVITIGTFDGVHLGHRKILSRLCEAADELDGTPVLLTFDPHPRIVLFPENKDLKLLQTHQEKTEKLSETGLEHLIIESFTNDFSRLSADQFVRDYLVNAIGVKKLIIGYDHQFGRNREGNLEKLRDLALTYEFEVEEIKAQDIDQVNISSTKIRNAINSGDMETANKFLGYPFLISGEVVEGDRIGRSIGFPTANIFVDDLYKILPMNGVYAVKVGLNGLTFDGMMNIGFRPTIKQDSNDRRIEIHLFNFEEQIYGQRVKVEVLKRIRDEMIFENMDSLIKQLKNDEKVCMDFINSNC